jgi:hypothetical protein
MKLIIKELIESSAKTGRNIDSSNVPLNHFFILMEQIFKHEMKCKRKLLISSLNSITFFVMYNKQ